MTQRGQGDRSANVIIDWLCPLIQMENRCFLIVPAELGNTALSKMAAPPPLRFLRHETLKDEPREEEQVKGIRQPMSKPWPGWSLWGMVRLPGSAVMAVTQRMGAGVCSSQQAAIQVINQLYYRRVTAESAAVATSHPSALCVQTHTHKPPHFCSRLEIKSVRWHRPTRAKTIQCLMPKPAAVVKAAVGMCAYY